MTRATTEPNRVENAEYCAMLRRMIRSYAKRVGAGDEVDLGDMAGLRETLDDAMASAVHAMRDDDIPWSYIAVGLGISRQAAWKRWG